MRKAVLFFVALFLLVYIFGSDNLFCQTASKKQGGHVIAYYFHGNFRCITCRTMEQYSKEAIEANFKDALSSGKLEFKAVNTDERGNEHYVSDYQLYTKSLVLSLLKDGKEIKSKNLTRIWDHVRDKQKFYGYVTEEVSDFLKEAK